MLSRRGFLRLGGKLGALGLIETSAPGWLRHLATGAASIAVPPSLMLHSKDWWLLPELLEALDAAGYRGITYLDLIAALFDGAPLPEKPVIISIDDLGMLRGRAFDYFEGMYRAAHEARFPVVFGIITRSIWTQVESRWDAVAGWAEGGMVELATHTDMHVSLDRADFTADDYDKEIGLSANIIRERTGQEVRTLILPGGRGYTPATGEIQPPIIAACQRAGISLVAGLPGGRAPLDTHAVLPDDVFLVGRTPPGLPGQESVVGAMFEVEHW